MALSSPYSIIADEMGLGKTWQSIALITRTRIRTAIVVPAYLSFNWKKEVQELTDCRVYTFSPKNPQVPSDAEVMIVPYSMLQKAENIFEWAAAVHFDESQYLMTPTSIRSSTAYKYLKKYSPQFCLQLSGTPIKNRVQEFYVALKILALDPANNHKITTRFPSHYTFCCHFANIIEKRIGYRTVVEFSGHKNVPELKTYLRGRYIRRLSDDVLDLPEAVSKIVAVEYKEDPLLGQLWEHYRTKGVMPADIKAKKQTAIVKAHFTAQYAKELRIGLNGAPILIFSDHRDPVRIIGLELSEFRTKMIDGNTPISTRSQYVQQFQNGQLDFLVCTIGSMEAGNTLTAANHEIFNDVSWVPGSNQQARGRIRRIGQSKRCFYHYMSGGATDSHIIKLLSGKENTIKEVVNV